MDRGAWQATVPGVANSQAQLATENNSYVLDTVAGSRDMILVCKRVQVGEADIYECNCNTE